MQVMNPGVHVSPQMCAGTFFDHHYGRCQVQNGHCGMASPCTIALSGHAGTDLAVLHPGAGQAARHCTLCIHRLCMLFHGHQRGVDVGREAARCDTVAQQKPKIS